MSQASITVNKQSAFQQSFFCEPLAQKSIVKNRIYPFSVKKLCDRRHAELIAIKKSAAAFSRLFLDKKNPYKKGIAEHKAWNAGLNFCGALEQNQ